jgi:hypothetical protein
MVIPEKYIGIGILSLAVMVGCFFLGRCSVLNTGSSTKTTTTTTKTSTETKIPIPRVLTTDSGKARIEYRVVEVPKYIPIEQEIDTNIWTKKSLVAVIDSARKKADSCCLPYTASKELVTKSNDTVGFWFKHPEGTYGFWQKPHQEYVIIRDNNTNTTITTETTIWNKFVFAIFVGCGANTDMALKNGRLGWSGGVCVGYQIK